MTDTKACKKTEKQVPPPLKKLKLHVIAFAFFFFCFFFDDPTNPLYYHFFPRIMVFIKKEEDKFRKLEVKLTIKST